MKIYLFDQQGILIGAGMADPSPLESDAWLIPANATDKEPPAEQGKVAVFNGTEWVLQPDFRKAALWLANGSPYEVGSDAAGCIFHGIGMLPVWITSTPPPDKFMQWDGAAWVLDKAAELADATERAEVELGKRRLQADHVIIPLQDAVELGMASKSDEEMLAEWKRYRVMLSRIQAQSGYPLKIDWPAAP